MFHYPCASLPHHRRLCSPSCCCCRGRLIHFAADFSLYHPEWNHLYVDFIAMNALLRNSTPISSQSAISFWLDVLLLASRVSSECGGEYCGAYSRIRPTPHYFVLIPIWIYACKFYMSWLSPPQSLPHITAQTQTISCRPTITTYRALIYLIFGWNIHRTYTLKRRRCLRHTWW